MTTYSLGIPTAHYQCEGAYDIAGQLCKLGDIHFQYNNYFEAKDLYYITLIDRAEKEECTGFFCEDCIKAFNRKPNPKRSLQAVFDKGFKHYQFVGNSRKLIP